MNPRLRILKDDKRAKGPFLALVRASASQPFNALLVIAEDRKPSSLFKAWFDATFPTATPLSLLEDIEDGDGYPTAYFLARAAEVGW